MTVGPYIRGRMPLFKAGSRGECPHCGTVVQFLPGLTRKIEPGPPGRRGRTVFQNTGADTVTYKYDAESHLELRAVECPSCNKLVISVDVPGPVLGEKVVTRTHSLLWPQYPITDLPAEMPAGIDRDYREAVAVRDRSPRAAAALLRRCLQATLIHAGNVTEKASLADQIEEALPDLPGYLADDVDAIRNVGNYAAHPLKSEDPERLLEVEEDEVEWLLEVLLRLLDFYYVSRPRSEERRARLNEKLTAAGKLPLKGKGGTRPSEKE